MVMQFLRHTDLNQNDLEAQERAWLKKAIEEGRKSGHTPIEPLEDRLARLKKEAVFRGLL